MDELPRIDVLTGNFNAHCGDWSSKHNRNGPIVKSFVQTFGYKIMNKRNEFTHYNSKFKTKGSPNLTLVCRQKVELIVNWKIGGDLSSDHLPMETEIKWKRDEKLMHRNKHWLFKKCDKQKYKMILENGMNEWCQWASQREDINEVYDHLKNTIIEAAQQACPRNTKRQQYRGVPFWNEKCSQEIQRKKKLRRQMERKGTILSRLFYRKQCKRTKRTIKDAKKEYLSKLLNNKQNNIQDIYKRIKFWNKKYTNVESVCINGRQITNEKIIANQINTFFSEVGSDPKTTAKET